MRLEKVEELVKHIYVVDVIVYWPLQTFPHLHVQFV
jgi:hypothetical protein